MTKVTKIVCDGGCGTTWDIRDTPRPAITGTRTDGWNGDGLPNGEFHWCRNCAKDVFTWLLGRES